MQCCDLFVQNEKIIESENYETYLGDIISKDGTNDEIIKYRENKGYGIDRQLTTMLKEIGLGSYSFHIGLLLRDTNLINGILFNSESWYGLKTKDIEKLENVDLQYMRKVFGASSKTPKEFLYMETGKIPIRFILKSRRLMFWFDIVNRNEKSLIQKFYKAQKIK